MKKLIRFTILIVIGLPLLSCVAPQVSRDELPEHPNVVFIITDDMTVSDLAYMRNTSALIEDQGAKFSRFFVNISMCCPSRASFLRGQYGQNTKIYDIEPPNGGFEKTYATGIERSMLPVWMRDSGYSTALFGKYMATYPHTAEVDYVPPGWVEWYSPVSGTPYDGFYYTLNENGSLVEYGDRDADYMTDVLANKAMDYMSRMIAQEQPFFAYISTYAPHRPSVPAPRHAGIYSSLELPQPPSFNEIDMSDKAKSMLWRQPMSNEDILYLEEHYRLRIESLQAVDEMVGNIIALLKNKGKIENTYVFFTSDNGIEMGEHRLVEVKNWPYDESMRVPLLVMGPGIRPGLQIAQLTGNIDIAPTIVEMANASAADFIDGRSMFPLLLREKVDHWRDAYLFQSAITSPEVTETANWYGLRTERYLYLEFFNGAVHLYDLKKDPYELDNFSGKADPDILNKFHVWLEKLRNCAADECHASEMDPEKWE